MCIIDKFHNGLVDIDYKGTVENEVISKDVTFTASKKHDRCTVSDLSSQPPLSSIKATIRNISGATNNFYTLLNFDFSSYAVSLSLRAFHINDLAINVTSAIPVYTAQIYYSYLNTIEFNSTKKHPEKHYIYASDSYKIDLKLIYASSIQVHTNVRILNVEQSRFFSINVSGPDQTKLEKCSGDEAVFVAQSPEDTLDITSCIFKKAAVIGPYANVVCTSTDLSGFTFNNTPDIVIYRCIGNGTTIKHVAKGDLFVNWTHDQVFVSTDTDGIERGIFYWFPIDDLDAITAHLMRYGHDSCCGWVIDTILDDPAEPFC